MRCTPVSFLTPFKLQGGRWTFVSDWVDHLEAHGPYKNKKECVQALMDFKSEMEDARHVGCPSYPNCDEGGLGCRVRTAALGVETEMYGYRD